MRFRLLLSSLALIVVSCTTKDVPAPIAGPQAPIVEAEPDGEPIANVRVTASKLNVRTEPNPSGAVVSSLKRGTKLALLRTEGEWSRVRLSTGQAGWVNSSFVKVDRGCLPDRDFQLVSAPAIALAETTSRETVTVEATVSPAGDVTSTRVIGNSTGDTSLATIAEKEIRSAKFAAPVKDCRAQRFIYVYRKTF